MHLLFLLFLYCDVCEYKETKYKYNYVTDSYLQLILILCNIILYITYIMNINNIYVKIIFGIWLLLRILTYFLSKLRLMERLYNEINI